MRIGVDLGGTKIEAIALSDTGEIVHRRRIPTPQGSYEETLHAIVNLVRAIESELKFHGQLGIGTPGAISPATGNIKNANSTQLIGHPLDKDLGASLDRKVRISNDANCFALSEAVDGAGRGAEVVFGVIIGTGTGGGIVVRGEVLTGPNAVAGEWGHNPLPWPSADELPGPKCYCGKHGCLETYVSGPGLARDFHGATGLSLDPPQIVDLTEHGDGSAESALRRYEDRLARGLAQIINILDPDIIVLGGGMAKVDRLYTNVPKLWSQYVFSDRVNTRLVPPLHGESSGVRGAAWLWPLKYK